MLYKILNVTYLSIYKLLVKDKYPGKEIFLLQNKILYRTQAWSIFKWLPKLPPKLNFHISLNAKPAKAQKSNNFWKNIFLFEGNHLIKLPGDNCGPANWWPRDGAGWPVGAWYHFVTSSNYQLEAGDREARYVMLGNIVSERWGGEPGSRATMEQIDIKTSL